MELRREEKLWVTEREAKREGNVELMPNKEGFQNKTENWLRRLEK